MGQVTGPSLLTRLARVRNRRYRGAVKARILDANGPLGARLARYAVGTAAATVLAMVVWPASWAGKLFLAFLYSRSARA